MMSEIASLVNRSIPQEVPAGERTEAENALFSYCHSFLIVATTVDMLEDAAKSDMDLVIRMTDQDNKDIVKNKISQNSEEIFRRIANSTTFKNASKEMGEE